MCGRVVFCQRCTSACCGSAGTCPLSSCRHEGARTRSQCGTGIKLLEYKTGSLVQPPSASPHTGTMAQPSSQDDDSDGSHLQATAARLIREADQHVPQAGERLFVIGPSWFSRLQAFADGSTLQVPGPVECGDAIVSLRQRTAAHWPCTTGSVACFADDAVGR